MSKDWDEIVRLRKTGIDVGNPLSKKNDEFIVKVFDYAKRKNFREHVEHFYSSAQSIVDNPFLWVFYRDKMTQMQDSKDKNQLTTQYLKNRTKKDVSAIASGAVSLIPLVGTGLNMLVGSGIAASAGISTYHHMKQLSEIAKKYPKEPEVAYWISVIIGLKEFKQETRVREGFYSLVSFIPGLSLFNAIVTLADKYDHLKTSFDVNVRVAAELHFSAYDGDDPAIEIINELFTRRTGTAVLGDYDVEGIIQEPGGWVAVYEKMTLI